MSGNTLKEGGEANIGSVQEILQTLGQAVIDREDARARVANAKAQLADAYLAMIGQNVPVEGSASGIIDPTTGQFHLYKDLYDRYERRQYSRITLEVAGADDKGLHCKIPGSEMLVVFDYEGLNHPYGEPAAIEM